jgi:Protein of unknown function, DUF547
VKPIFWLVFIFQLTLVSCFRKPPDGSGSAPVDHAIYDTLLCKYVNRNGMVDYKGLEKEHKLLTNYLQALKENPPADSWTENEKLAYWINAYNAFTLDLILRKKPEKSIKDITAVNIPFINSPWQIDFIEIGDKKLDLDDIEHGIIRKYFNEPRIHFALVCAAFSCPRLRQEAYVGSRLDKQLTNQARSFLGDVKRNQLSSNHVKISKIFQWYGSDFTKNGSLIDFLNQYSAITIKDDAKVEYMEYDWRLNSQDLFPDL